MNDFPNFLSVDDNHPIPWTIITFIWTKSCYLLFLEDGFLATFDMTSLPVETPEFS